MEQKIDNLITKFGELETRLSTIEEGISTRDSEHVRHQPADTAVPTTVHSQGQARVESIEESTLIVLFRLKIPTIFVVSSTHFVTDWEKYQFQNTSK